MTRSGKYPVNVNRACGERHERLERLRPRGTDKCECRAGVRLAEDRQAGKDEDRIPEAASPDDRHVRARRQIRETGERRDRTVLSS